MISSNYLKGRRIRLFGGPNGSGKSTIFNLVDQHFDIGYYINADEIEQTLSTHGFIDLTPFSVIIEDSRKFKNYLSNHTLFQKAVEAGFELSVEGRKSKIVCKSPDSLSYEAALIADFLRYELINRGSKLTFESVMSHPSKISVLKEARRNGYKPYLYFVCTSSPEINIERVNLRVKMGGHRVDKQRIIDRYASSLDLLKSAVSQKNRSFIWDNSGKAPVLILEVYQGKHVRPKTYKIPDWVDKYLMSKA